MTPPLPYRKVCFSTLSEGDEFFYKGVFLEVCEDEQTAAAPGIKHPETMAFAPEVEVWESEVKGTLQTTETFLHDAVSERQAIVDWAESLPGDWVLVFDLDRVSLFTPTGTKRYKAFAFVDYSSYVKLHTDLMEYVEDHTVPDVALMAQVFD